MDNLSVLVLAAGEGTRMKSALPKVLHRLAGQALLSHVLDAVAPLSENLAVVVGFGAEEVKRQVAEDFPRCQFFVQKERRGSGHAVRVAQGWLRGQGGDVLVLCGDAPLITTGTLGKLLQRHRRERNDVTLLTACLENPAGYGRIIRNAQGRPRAIVEQRDASPQELSLREINSGVYAFRAAALLKVLGGLKTNNAKNEFYITDVVKGLVRVGAHVLAEPAEISGVNTREDLARVTGLWSAYITRFWMARGVTLEDPASTQIGRRVRLGRDTVVHPQTIILGRTQVGSGAELGPWTLLEDTRVGSGSQVVASMAQGAVIGARVKVGPYARLRPGTRLAVGSRVGNFVEVKKSSVGRGAKINHLAYVGDAAVGPRANIGAGVITCNYDGVRKHPTVIGAGAFVGSNVNLVAPVQVGARAVVGAGSTITRNVPAEALGLERSTQVTRPGWARQRRQQMKREASHP